MQNWVLKTVSVEWKEGTVRLELSSGGTLKVIRAKGLSDLRLNRKSSVNPDVSVKHCEGPTKLQGGEYSLVIEMQSGGKIELVARQFEMPSN
jgi:hypothetical protein